MNSREAFEDLVCKVTNARNFAIREEDGEYASERVQDMFLIWGAVCAQSVQSVKPVAWMNPSNPHEVISYKKKNEIQRCYNLGIGKSAERYSVPLYPQPAQQGSVPDSVIRQCEDAIQYASEIRGGCISGVREAQKRVRAILDTPQPAQQGSVPEGWRECLQEMVQAMHDYEMSVDEAAPYKHRAMMDRAHALLSATPQPEGDGWRPTLDWAIEKCRALQSQGFDRVRLDVLEKDFINAIEAHRPHPPQEGEGDEQ